MNEQPLRGYRAVIRALRTGSYKKIALRKVQVNPDKHIKPKPKDDKGTDQ